MSGAMSSRRTTSELMKTFFDIDGSSLLLTKESIGIESADVAGMDGAVAAEHGAACHWIAG
jgi:hypothetical protein